MTADAQTRTRSAPPTSSGARDKVIITVATLSIALDWIPEFVLGIDPDLFSFTKHVLLPTIFIDFIINTRSYLRLNVAWLYCIAFVVGCGVNLYAGILDWSRFRGLLPTPLILLFFSLPRSRRYVRSVLKMLFWSGLPVAAIIFLSYFGILVTEPTRFQSEQGERILAAISWSKLGLYFTTVSASWGGLLLSKHGLVRLNARRFILATGSILLCLGGIAVTGQRAAFLSFIIAAVLPMLWLARISFTRASITVVILGMLSLVLTYSWWSSAEAMSSTLVARFESTESFEDEASASNRIEMHGQWFNDLVIDVNLTGPGTNYLVARYGRSIHSILGESYYDGGVLLLIALSVVLFSAFKRLVSSIVTHADTFARVMSVLLLSVFISDFLFLLTHPGLRNRLFFMVIGLGLSSRKLGVRTTALPSRRHDGAEAQASPAVQDTPSNGAGQPPRD